MRIFIDFSFFVWQMMKNGNFISNIQTKKMNILYLWWWFIIRNNKLKFIWLKIAIKKYFNYKLKTSNTENIKKNTKLKIFCVKEIFYYQISIWFLIFINIILNYFYLFQINFLTLEIIIFFALSAYNLFSWFLDVNT